MLSLKEFWITIGETFGMSQRGGSVMSHIRVSATSTWSPQILKGKADFGDRMGEMFHLDELAKDCAKDGVYEFLFVASVIPFTNGAGSPVNPLAIK